MLVAILLARLLTPREFGLAAVVLVLAGLAAVFVDPALGTALIQRKSINERDRSTIFWVSAGLGAVFTGLFIAAAGPLAAFYGEPDLEPLIMVFSFTFVLMGLQTTQATLMTREMDFRNLELRMIAATVAGGGVGVACALLGLGAWALIWQALTVSAVSTVLLWVFSSWRPHLIFSQTSLRELGGNGARAYGTKIVWFLNSNTDTILIARFLGPASLGLYALAFNLMLFPISRIATPIQNVLFPAFSRLQDERARLGDAWMRGNRLIAAVAMPAMLGMIVVAPDFVAVVLGDRWVDAVPVLQVLAIVGLVQSLQTIGGSALQAVGRFGTVLRFTAASYAANLLAFAAGLRWGIEGVAVGYALATGLLFPVFMVLVARAVHVPVARAFGSLWGVTQASLLMLGAVFATRVALVEQGVDAPLRLAAAIILGGAVYAATCAWRAPDVVEEIRRLRRRRSVRGVPPRPAVPHGAP